MKNVETIQSGVYEASQNSFKAVYRRSSHQKRLAMDEVIGMQNDDLMQNKSIFGAEQTDV